MTELQKTFAQLFEESGQTITPEIKPLFDRILTEDFGDDPEKMTAFMLSLQPGVERVDDPRQDQIDMLQETVLQLSELLLGGI